MAQCEVCGNDYDKTIIIMQEGHRHIFDCFECAIQALAPVCDFCGCRIIGHGVEAGDNIYCCVSCAANKGVHGLCDRVEHELAGSPR